MTAVMTLAALAAAGLAASPTPAPHSLSLNEVLDRAINHAPSVRAAGARTQSARSVPDQVSAWPAPTVGVSAMAWPGDFSTGTEIWYKASQEFPLTGMLDRRKEAADAEALGAEAESETVKLDAVFRIRIRYADLEGALMERRIILEQMETMRRMEHLAETAYASAAEKSSSTDPMRARAEIFFLDDSLAEIDGLAEAARADMSAAAGLDAGESVQDPDLPDILAYSPGPFPDIEKLMKTAEGMRPEFKSAEARIRASESKAEAADDERIPDLMIEAGVRQQIGTDMPVAFMVGTSMPLPWLTPGKFDAMVAGARAEKAEREADRETLRNSIASGLRIMSARHASIRKGIDLYKKAISELVQAEHAATSAYASGLGDIDAVINLELRLLEAKRILVQRISESHRIKAELDRVIGRPVTAQAKDPEGNP